MSKKDNETVLTKKFCDDIVRHNGFVVPMVAGKMQRPGLPDRYACHAQFGGVWMEFKRGRKKVTDLQRITIWKMLDRDVVAFVVRFIQTGEIVAEIPDRSSSAVRDAWTLGTKDERGEESSVRFVYRMRCMLLRSGVFQRLLKEGRRV